MVEDVIVLDQSVYKELAVGALPANQFHLGTAAAHRAEHIIYDSVTGDLFYDPDGSGAKARSSCSPDGWPRADRGGLQCDHLIPGPLSHWSDLVTQS